MDKLFELTAKGRYYKVYLNGTYISSHTTEREAVEKSAWIKFSNPYGVVRYKHEYEVDVALTTAGLTVAGTAEQQVDDPPVILSTPAPIFVVGIADNYFMNAHVFDDGLSPLVYTITNPLPSGLNFDQNTGILSYDGVGPLSTSSHTLQATDAVGMAESSLFNIIITEVEVDQNIPNLAVQENQWIDMSQYISDPEGLITDSSIFNITSDASYNHQNKRLTGLNEAVLTGLRLDITAEY